MNPTHVGLFALAELRFVQPFSANDCEHLQLECQCQMDMHLKDLSFGPRFTQGQPGTALCCSCALSWEFSGDCTLTRASLNRALRIYSAYGEVRLSCKTKLQKLLEWDQDCLENGLCFKNVTGFPGPSWFLPLWCCDACIWLFSFAAS